jgi:actin
MSHGEITNWDDMEKLWHHLFYNELSAAPDEHAVLLSEAPMTPKTSRERTVQTMFETFNVPGCFLSPDACLALAASGRTAGLVLDVGEGSTNSVPIYEGFALRTAIARADLTGHDLTQFLAASFPPDFNSQVVRGIKEKLCYVALDPEQEAEAGRPAQDYPLPDGQIVSVGNERYTRPRTPPATPLTITRFRFKVPEALFNPLLVGKETSGLHEVVHRTLCTVDIDLQPFLRQTIVLSGGTTNLPGLTERIQKELVALQPAETAVIIDHPGNNKYLPWDGGSIIAALSSFRTMCCTKDEYAEEGPSVVHRSTPEFPRSKITVLTRLQSAFLERATVYACFRPRCNHSINIPTDNPQRFQMAWYAS